MGRPVVPNELKVRVVHLTEKNSNDLERSAPEGRVFRWMTVVRLYRRDLLEMGAPESEALVAEGRSMCCAGDQPCRRIGRDIAVGRALKALNERIVVEQEGLDSGG